MRLAMPEHKRAVLAATVEALKSSSNVVAIV